MKSIIFFLIPLAANAELTDCKTCGLMTWGSVLLGYLTVIGIGAILLVALYLVIQKIQQHNHNHKMEHHS
jgi:hypothetical protein